MNKHTQNKSSSELFDRQCSTAVINTQATLFSKDKNLQITNNMTLSYEAQFT